MVLPTQDMDISSSFTSIDFLQNNDSSRILYNKETAMDGKNKMNLKQIYKNSADIQETCENQDFRDTESVGVKLSEETFPWLTRFDKVMHSSIRNPSYHLLKRLLSVYTQNILVSTNTCCIKTSEVTQLKSHLNNTLTFFHFYWHDIKERISDHDPYFNDMSVLLGIYVDMELKTFRRSNDSSKVAAKLFTTLWIYLNNSEKHIFRVLLRLKLITKKYTKICDPIFMKSFTSLRKNIDSVTDIDYVRYLLVLKLWKRVKEDSEEKKKVNKFALTILGPRMPKMRDELFTIIPKPPVGHENETIWLLQPNVFDLKKARDHFLKLEETIYPAAQFQDSHLTKNAELQHYQKSRTAPMYDGNYFQERPMVHERCRDRTIGNGSINQVCPKKKHSKSKKYEPVSNLKPGEVILIDLTQEDDKITNKKNKIKSKRKLEWLKMMTKQDKKREHLNEVDHSSHAHSTESLKNSLDKNLLNNLPISDNKVSESTESCNRLGRNLLEIDTCHINSENTHDCDKKNKDLQCTLQNKPCDLCTVPLKQDEMQHNRLLCLLKLFNLMGHNIKDPKAIIDLLKEGKEQHGILSSPISSLHKNKTNSSNDTNTQDKEELFTQQKRSIETILSSTECQNSVLNTDAIKQELPTSTDCNLITDPHSCFQSESVYIQNVNCHLNVFRSGNNHASQVVEVTNQKMPCNVNERVDPSKRIQITPFSYHNGNMFATVKSEDTAQSIDDNLSDKKTICDKNIMCMLNDIDECRGVLHRIGEYIISVHAEKQQREECSEKTDVCAVSTTVFGDQSKEPPLGSWAKDINSLMNSEKFNKILDLYGEKEFLNVYDSKDFCKLKSRETTSTENPLDYDSKETIISTFKSEKLHSHGSDDCHAALSENKLPQILVCNPIKSETTESATIENAIESSNLIKEEPQTSSELQNCVITNIQAHSPGSPTFYLTGSDHTLNHELTCDPPLQFSAHKTKGTNVNSIEEFENIDILDSILNGDMSMEDEREILENSQSSLMSPISYDNSTNVLNCITEFFTQSEHAYTENKEEKPHITSGMETSLKPLPEGSLGTTGILNSLLDFDLTNMDSPPNDFMYSNVQTVNPRLIKKSLEEEISLTSTCYNVSEPQFQEQTCLFKKSSTQDILPRNETESYINQNDSIDSSMGLGLNTSEQETFEFPSLITNAPGLPMTTNSDIVPLELKESLSKYTHSSSVSKSVTNTMTERSYTYQRKRTTKQVKSLCEAIDCPSSEISTSKNISSSLLTSTTTTNQGEDLYDCENLQNCASSQRELLETAKYNCKGKSNRVMKHSIEVNVQSRSKKRRKKKEENEQREISPIVQSNSDELDLRYPQLTCNPLSHQETKSIPELPLSSFRIAYRQKSPNTICATKSTCQKLKCVGIQELRDMTRHKQQILVNFHGESTTDVILKNDLNAKSTGKTVKGEIVEDSPKANLTRNRTCCRFSKRNVKVGKDVVEMNLGEQNDRTKVSDELLIKPAKSSELIRKQMVATNFSLNHEETPLKKRRTSKFLPLLKADTVVCSINQQEDQEKHLVSMKTDYVCAGRRKNMVGE